MFAGYTTVCIHPCIATPLGQLCITNNVNLSPFSHGHRDPDYIQYLLYVDWLQCTKCCSDKWQ